MSTVSHIARENSVKAFYEDKKLWAYCALLAAVFIFSHIKLFTLLVGSWLNSSVYSHGFLVPLISLYLVWEYKGMLGRISPSPAYVSGFLLLLFGLILHLTGQRAGVLIIQEASLIVTIAAIVLFILGPRFLKGLAFPILYLSFMLTSWGIFTERLHMPFQLFSADLGTRLLHIAGVPAYMESVYIALPDITLEVARECSGVNYLVAVAAIGMPLAYIAIKSWPRRVLLVAGALIIAVLANSLRVALIGVLSYHHISGALHGPMHILHGMFVSVIGFIVLFAGVLLLSEKKSAGIKTGADPRSATPAAHIKEKTDRYPIFITALMLLFFGIFLNYFPPSPVKPKLDIKQFPDKIGEWSRLEKAPSGIVPDIGADHEILRAYRRADGEEMTLYIGYYEQQTQGREMVNDWTKRLHAGSEKKSIAITDNGREMSVRMNRLTGSAPEGSLILFWYDLNGRIVDERMSAMASTAWNGIVRGRTNGGFIAVKRSLKTDIGTKNVPGGYEEDFIAALIPILKEYI